VREGLAMTSIYEGKARVISARPKVLVVEDEGIVAECIRQDLQSFGYDVIGITESGRAAIEIARRIRPDVVVMDIRIKSDLNGIETAVCLQGLYEEPIPILFTTAYWDEDNPLIVAVNPCAALKKPFSSEELTSSILKVMFSNER
jgi:two-component system, response regulator PdtaR